MRLVYRSNDRAGVPLTVNDFVPFAYAPTRFGGQRQWLTCLNCRRRWVLYGGNLFRCRRRYGLRYRSQSEPPHRRALDRAAKISKRLAEKWGVPADPDE